MRFTSPGSACPLVRTPTRDTRFSASPENPDRTEPLDRRTGSRPRRGRGVDVTAPATGLVPAALDELLEPVHVAVDALAQHPGLVGHLLQETVRIDVHLRRDPGAARPEPMECDHTGVPRPGFRGPGDPLVRVLLGDRRVELARDTPDPGHPMGVRVVQLPNLFDTLPQLRDRLEPGPLALRGRHRNRPI